MKQKIGNGRKQGIKLLA